MPTTAPHDRSLRAVLDPLRPLFDRADAEDQDRLLDLALAILGHEPGWDEWLAYAREYLPHYRQRDRLVAVGPQDPGSDRARYSGAPSPLRFLIRIQLRRLGGEYLEYHGRPAVPATGCGLE